MIGQFVTGNHAEGADPVVCDNFVNADFSACLTECTTGFSYLQRVCLASANTTFTSSTLNDQIAMYNLKQTFPTVVWVTFVLLVMTGVLYSFIVCVPKIIYFYIVTVFLMLLAFSFYLLKNLEVRAATYPDFIFSGSIFQSDEDSIRYLAYLFLTIYLVIFPLVLFSPKKIRMAARILARMKGYFRKMLTMHAMTGLVILLGWGLMMLEIYLIMFIFTTGT